MRVRWLGRAAGIGVLRLAVTLIAAILIAFVLVRLSPFSPVTAQLLGGGLGVSDSLKLQIEYYYSLYPSGPLYLQFLSYLWQVLNGNLGHSIVTQQPVTEIIANSLPWTLLVVVTSVVISFALGTVIGMVLAYRRSRKIDSFGTVLSTITYSIPVYVLGILLLILFSSVLHLLPGSGAYDIGISVAPSFDFIGSVIAHAILPITSLVLVSYGAWALSMRANTISVMGEDYVSAAEARGFPDYLIAIRYVGRNAILPQFTNLVLALGFSLAGSVFVETIFTYPGLGYQLITAIEYNDYPVVMGIFITYVIALVVGLFMADLLYGVLDPRVSR